MKGKKIDLGKMTTLFVLLVLCLLLTILSPVFLTGRNLINILQQITVNGVVAVGITLVIFTGGIDISVGSVLALVGVIMGKLMVEMGVQPFLAIIVGILVGMACGAFNGLMIAKFKLQPMIATLGMMSMARGAALTIANGKTITGYSQGFRYIGSGVIPGTEIPVQIIFMLILYGVVFYIMKYRKAGRYIYAIGGNEEATRLSGINVTQYKMMAYIASGISCALASIVLVSKLNSAQSSAGLGYEMDAIASAVIGGASLTGGFGSIWGTLAGAVVIGVIRNGLNLLNVSSYLQQFILGAVILAAVLFDSYKIHKK